MRTIKLTAKEKKIEDAIIGGEYQKVSKQEFDAVLQAVRTRKKDAVLNLRVNSQDLDKLKKKAEKIGIKYQTFLSEFIHRLAQS